MTTTLYPADGSDFFGSSQSAVHNKRCMGGEYGDGTGKRGKAKALENFRIYKNLKMYEGKDICTTTPPRQAPEGPGYAVR